MVIWRRNQCFGLFFVYGPFVTFAPCRKLNLLSFGEEAEEEEKELAAVKQKIKSSHDVLDDPRLLKSEFSSKELVMVQFLFLLFFFSPNFPPSFLGWMEVHGTN